MLLTATMSGEWSVGVAVHAGTTRLAYVGLGDVRLESPDERFTPDYVSLQDLCSQNYSRPMSIWIGEDGMLDGGGLLETPHDIWCAFHAAGSSAGSLLGMAWLPAVLALGATSVYELKTWVVRFEEIVARAESLGLTGSLFNYAVLLLWSLLWLLLVMALTAYASLSPGSIGIGDAHFGGSFGLVRAMVLLTSVCGMALGAHTLKLWDARQMGELLQGLKEARALKRSLYVLLLAQLLLYAVVSLQVCLGASLGLAAPCAAGRRLLGTRHCTRTTRTLPMHHTHRTHTAHVHRTHTARRRLATGRRLLCTHLLRRSSLSRHQGTQPLGGLHTAHRGHATSRCGDAMYAGSPGILPAVGALHGLLLHSHLQVLLPRPHGNATHQGETHTHRTHLPQTTARVQHAYHTRTAACTCAAPPLHPPTQRARHRPHNCSRYLARGRHSHPRALFGADQVCAPATVRAAGRILRRRRPAHSEGRVQCVRWAPVLPTTRSFSGLSARSAAPRRPAF